MSTRFRSDKTLINLTKDVPRFLYLGSIFRTLGYSVLGIFGNIFLFNVCLELGFAENEAFAFVLLRQFLSYFLKLLIIFPVTKFINKLGPKTVLVIGPALSAITISLYALCQNSLWWLIPNVIVFAFQSNFYWIPYHLAFSSKNGENSIGKQMGILSVVSSVISIITPVLSSVVIQNFGGYNILFIISFLLFILSSISFSVGELDLKIEDINFKNFKLFFQKERRLFPDYLVIGAENIVQNVVWGIFVYLFVGNVVKLGILSSCISLTIAISAYFVGKLSDDKKVGGIDKLGAVFNGIIWIGKMFIQNGLHIFFLDSLFSLFRTTYTVPIDVIAYTDAKTESPMWAVVIREIALDIGRSIMALLSLIIVLLQLDYWLIFLLASVGYLLLGFFLKNNEQK